MKVCDKCGEKATDHASMWPVYDESSPGMVTRGPQPVEADLCSGCAREIKALMMGKGAATKPMSKKGSM